MHYFFPFPNSLTVPGSSQERPGIEKREIELTSQLKVFSWARLKCTSKVDNLTVSMLAEQYCT